MPGMKIADQISKVVVVDYFGSRKDIRVKKIRILE
jgi:hypothetical protein